MEQVYYNIGKYKLMPDRIRQIYWKAKQEISNLLIETSTMYADPVRLTEKEIHEVLRNNPEILENFFKQCKKKKILRDTTDSCLRKLDEIYEGEEKSLQAREIKELFGDGDPKNSCYTNGFAKRKENTLKRRGILKEISLSWSLFKGV
jgi:hypothetical protein